MQIQKKHILGTMVATSMLYACGGGGSSSEAPAPVAAPLNGALSLSVVGLPAQSNSAISVVGPNGFTREVSQNTTLSGLAPGTYTLTSSPVVVDNVEFDVTPATTTLNISANNTTAQELIYMTDIQSSGVISNFGSVFVNGVRFTTDDAEVETDDNENASENDLSVGMTVLVQGRQTADGKINEANKITHFVHAEGPLEAVSLSQNQLIVFGQTYQIDSRTVFDDTSLLSLQPGDIIEISAIRSGDNTWLATYVELEEQQDTFKLKGELSNLNQEEQTFTLGQVTIDFSQADVDTSLSNGLFVKIEANQGAINNVILADEIEQADTDSDSDRISVDGMVTEISENGFLMSGRSILWDESSTFKAGTSADIVIGARVKVSGSISANGFIAQTIRFDKQGEIELSGRLEAIDLENNTISLLGSVFVVDEFSHLEDDSNLEIRRFSLDQLNIGDLIEIEAFSSAGDLVLKKLEREETVGESDSDENEAKLKGQVIAINGTSLELQGLTISTAQYTEFELGDRHVSLSVFFDRLQVSDWIEVEGIRQSDGSILATEIETSSASGRNGDDQSGTVEFEGEISSFVSPESFKVNGRLITTDERTVFEDNALQMLDNGIHIEIYGLEAGNGDILATRIEIEDIDNDEFDIEIKGLLSADASNGVIVINNQEILFNTSTEFSDGSAQDLLQGRFVEVEAVLNNNGSLFAEEIYFEDLDEQNTIDIEGEITEIISTSEIIVAGIRIILNDNTEFENGNTTSIEVGHYVEVEGRFDDTLQLIAEELEFTHVEPTELEGLISQVLSENEFVLNGFTIQHNRFTRFEDGSVENIETDTQVEVKGIFNDDEIFVAQKIEFYD